MFVCPPVRRSFSDERRPGTVHSLGDLPKRKCYTSPRKSPVFHIPHDDDDEHASSIDEHLLSTPPTTVRFPTSSSDSPPSSPAPLPTSPSPQLSRGASAPILLSNGKPLKPSLKSSSSSPAMLIPSHIHLRARSEPSTPKNVHFPTKDYALATVRVFNRSARPAALSKPSNGNGDETETEGEDAPHVGFPFPSLPPILNYEIDPTNTSPVPSKSFHPANLLLESLNLPSSSFSSNTTAKPLLTGSILVRNLAFEKHVTIRFTLDDWQTVSEVGAHFLDSLPRLPSNFSPSPSPEDTRGKGWDRFVFSIHLEDYAPSLSTRTLWIAARYHVNSTYPEPGSFHYGPGGEWWDNNGGENYRVKFRPVIAAFQSSRIKPRRETVSAPITAPRIRIRQPETCKEHVSGLLFPSVSNKKDRRSTALRTGKLSLCNYVPPIIRAPSSPQTSSSPSLNTETTLPSSTSPRSHSDEESTSPASSTLSTPSVSPIMVPRIIIGGQPATSTSEEDDGHAITYLKPGHIADWDWLAPGEPRIEGPSRQPPDVVTGSEPPERRRNVPSLSGKDNNSLYDAFVTQWCFAQEPSPSHHAHDGSGIMT